MDPVTATVLAVVGAGLGAAGKYTAAKGEADALDSQARMEQQKAAIESEWADKKSLEARVSAQSNAYDERRKATLAKSRLTALAGASGGGSEDKTIMDLWSGIDTAGIINSGRAVAEGNQQAQGIKYQADLNTWTAGENANIKRRAAKTTLRAGMFDAVGSFVGGMAGRYGGSGAGGGSATGFG